MLLIRPWPVEVIPKKKEKKRINIESVLSLKDGRSRSNLSSKGLLIVIEKY